MLETLFPENSFLEDRKFGLISAGYEECVINTPLMQVKDWVESFHKHVHVCSWQTTILKKNV